MQPTIPVFLFSAAGLASGQVLTCNWYGIRDVAWITRDRINGGVLDAYSNLRNEISSCSQAVGTVRAAFNSRLLAIDERMPVVISALNDIASIAKEFLPAGRCCPFSLRFALPWVVESCLKVRCRCCEQTQVCSVLRTPVF